MLVMCVASNQHVIQVHEDKGEATQYLVHQPLEGLARVAEAKRHPDELEEAKWGADCCLVHMLWLDWYLVIAFPQVQLGEHSASVP